MAAPELTFSITGNKISAVSGFDSITVTFSSDIAYTAFECRATKSGEDWGRGKGALIASFSQTPAGTQRTFEVYDDFLLSGDGEYRISLFAQGADGSWNISTHAPAGGATDGKFHIPLTQQEFLLAPLREGRPSPIF